MALKDYRETPSLSVVCYVFYITLIIALLAAAIYGAIYGAMIGFLDTTTDIDSSAGFPDTTTDGSIGFPGATTDSSVGIQDTTTDSLVHNYTGETNQEIFARLTMKREGAIQVFIKLYLSSCSTRYYMEYV